LLLLCAGAMSPAQDSARPRGWVVIPVTEYRDLRARAFPAPAEPQVPAVDATLTRVDYDLRVNGDLAAGRASITVDVFRDGWVRAPIPEGLLVREATLEGKPVSLVPGPAGNRSLFVLLSKRGRTVLTMDVAVPVSSASGEETLALPAGAAGVTRASVTLPRREVEVRIADGLLAEKSETGTDTKWVAYGQGNGPLRLTWRQKMEDHHASQPLRFRGALTELLGLGEDSTAVSAVVDVEIMQGVAREVRIETPQSVTINQVAGASVGDWEVKAGELLVTLIEPEEKTTRFVITGETRLAREGGLDLPILQLAGAERESGGVAVEVLGAGEIKDAKLEGLERTDAAQMDALVSSRQSPSLEAFRFRPGAARSLHVDVARYAQQAVLTANVEEARYRVLMSQDGKTLVQARYAVRNNQRNFVRIALPAGASVWGCSLNGKPARPGQASDGSLLFPLLKTRASEEAPAFPVEVLYLNRATAWADKGQARVTLPALDLPVSRTGLVLYYPPLFEASVAQGPFRKEEFAGPVSAALKPGAVQIPEAGAPPEAMTQAKQQSVEAQAATQKLVDLYKAKPGGRASATAAPAPALFPAVGPSLFLVSELTAENQAQTLTLDYQREKKGRGK